MKIALFLCSLLALPAGAASAADSPWNGTWKLDEAKSQFTGGTMTFSKGAGDMLHFSDGSTTDYDFAIDGKERKAMLAAKVEDMINTVVRQIAFYTFERAVHTERKSGELTAERIGELWLDVQRESLGPAIELKPGYETFWVYIPHFIHTPFYVYAYAFGDCLVNSLYAVYERADEGFAERYLAMLSAGGTKHYSELLAPFGLDARDPAFWQGGIGIIERLIGELEALQG